MGNNALITYIESRTFYGTNVDGYYNGEAVFTRKQIGEALGYSEAQKAIDKIHTRHNERLDKFSVPTKLTGTDGKLYDTVVYNLRGVFEICRWSKQPKADEVMDFLYDMGESVTIKGYFSTMSDEKLLEVLSEKVHGNSGYMARYVSTALDKRWDDRMMQCGALWDKHGLNWPFSSSKYRNYDSEFGKIWYDDNYGFDYDGYEACVRKVGQLIRLAKQCKHKEDIPKWPKPGEPSYNSGRYQLARKRIDCFV